MPKVLISDKMDPRAAQIFRDRGVEVDEIIGKTPDELKAIIGDYDGLAIRSSTKVTADLLEHATNLKVVGRAGIGVDNVDIPAASAKGVVVMNTPFGNSITTAEHAIALMFALARQLPEADASTQAGKWEKNRFMGVELTAKVLGVVGCGNIGSIVADPDGKARHILRAPDGSGTVLWTGREFNWVQVFTADPEHDQAYPNRGRALAIEPMTCPPNAFNSGIDQIVLEPGQTWSAKWGMAAL